MFSRNKNLNLSPLFWPIKLQGDTIHILDETLLPHKCQYIKARSVRQACQAIKDMKTRAVGQVLLVMYIFLLVIKQNKSGNDLGRVLSDTADRINATRPTLSFKYLTDMALGWYKSGKPLDKAIEGFLEMLKTKRIEQAKRASELIEDGETVLTHCNISGLMPLIGEFCAKEDKKITFFATETRPYLQGSRLTAWELDEAGFSVTIIADNTVAQIMSEGKINKVIVGADNLTANGDIANKIGTYQIAILAKHFNIPFCVICPPPTAAKTGKDIKIEIRPDKELLVFAGVRIAPEGVKGYYPAFDITPKELITKHIYMEIDQDV